MANQETKPKTSQPQNTPDPVAAGFQTFTKLTEDTVGRLDALLGELADMEAKGYERARKAMDDAANLASEWLDYQRSLANEWRRMMLDAVRRQADLFSQGAN